MAWKFFAQDGYEKITAESTSSVGLITPFAGSAAPSGWLLCQGQELDKVSYPDLAQALGQTYGSFTNGSGADGNTHFRLPDFRGRAPVGFKGGQGNGSSGTGSIAGPNIPDLTHGQSYGAESVTLSADESGVKSHSHTFSGSHNHTVTNTSHAHTVYYGSSAAIASGTVVKYPDGNNPSTLWTDYVSLGASLTSELTNISINDLRDASASASHTNVQPFLVVNYIIRVVP